MKMIDVGAFAAKTHLSQLLDEVERGAEVRISRRSKPVAVLTRDETLSRDQALDALAGIRALREAPAASLTMDEIIGCRNEGRER